MFSFEDVVFMLCTGVVAISLILNILCPEVLKNFLQKKNPTWIHSFLQAIFVLAYVLGLLGILITIWNTYLNI